MRLIDADVLTEGLCDGEVKSGGDLLMALFKVVVDATPTVDAVPVCCCKDCKHRPTKQEKYVGGYDLEFPDKACPCCCRDPFYSWYPNDDWFCPRGERKGGDE